MKNILAGQFGVIIGIMCVGLLILGAGGYLWMSSLYYDIRSTKASNPIIFPKSQAAVVHGNEAVIQIGDLPSEFARVPILSLRAATRKHKKLSLFRIVWGYHAGGGGYDSTMLYNRSKKTVIFQTVTQAYPYGSCYVSLVSDVNDAKIQKLAHSTWRGASGCSEDPPRWEAVGCTLKKIKEKKIKTMSDLKDCTI